jgi:hypothetical protein
MEDLDKPLAFYWEFFMRIQNYWRYPGCGPHAAAYLGDGLVAAPSKYGNRITFWNVSDIERPELVADLPDRPDCQSVAFCTKPTGLRFPTEISATDIPGRPRSTMCARPI